MSKAGTAATAIGQGMQTFGELESQRKSGGGGSSSLQRAADSAIAAGTKAAASAPTVKDTVPAPKYVDLPVEKRPVIPREMIPEMTNSRIPSMDKGGRIKKTGIYRVHKDEFIIPADIVKRVDKRRKTSRKSGRK